MVLSLGLGRGIGVSTNLIGLAEGYVSMTAVVSIPDVASVEESRLVLVGPELRLSIGLTGVTNGGQATLSFPALAGRRYVVEVSDASPRSQWKAMRDDIVGQGTNAIVSIAISGQPKLYRVTIRLSWVNR